MSLFSAFVPRAILIGFFILTISCTNSIDYEYEFGLRSYLKSKGVQDLEKQNNLLIISPKACNSCIAGVFQKLTETDKKVIILVVGKEVDLQDVPSFEKIITIHEIIFDETNEIFKYRTGFGSISYFEFLENEITFFLEVNESTKDNFYRRLD